VYYRVVKDSTLRPGKTPDYIRKLRDEALKELNSPGKGEKKAPSVGFDHKHKEAGKNTQSENDFDANNGVSQYPGQNVPHIGNGSGGVR